MLIDLDKFIASMIEAFPAFKEEGRIPCMYKEALEAQGLEYKDGEIVKTQRMVSSDVKEDGCGVSEDKRIMEKIIATIRLYYGVPLEDEAKEMIVWLEKQGSEPNWCHHKVDLSNCSEEYRKAYYDGWNNCNQQHSQCKSESNDVVKCLINGMKFYYEDNEEATWGTEKFSMKVKDILSWLEKQGQKKHIDDLTQQEAMDIAVAKCFEQGEQKHAGKVEPKFQNGQWIVWQNKCYKVNYNGCGYELIDQNGLRTSLEYGTVDESAHLWAIQDAKDGDVLKEDSCIFIIERMKPNETAIVYCCLFDDGDFDLGSTLSFDIDSTKPATKEQRDMLFQKMHEAGYTFDFEKKELKKLKFRVGDEVITENEESLTITRIDEEGYWSNDLFICDFDSECVWDLVKQKPAEWKQENREELTEFENAMMHIGGSFFGENAGLDPNDTDTIKEQAELLLELAPKTEWSEEDERIYQSIIDDTVQENQLDSKQIDWLKSIKSRVQPKQEWSEEDEKNLRRAIRATKVVYPVTADWLKSIRNRITLKPSIEQMKILEKVTGVDIEKTLNGFQNFYAHENSGKFPSAIEIAKHFYKLGLKTSDTELENLLWTLPESIADERSHQVYLMSLYHCDGQCFVDYVGELEEDSLVCFEGETFMEAATKMREWIRKRPKLRKI